MMFETLHGNDPLKTYLRKALDNNQLPHTLLFAGLEGIGKKQFAREIAAHLLQTTLTRLPNHPDFFLHTPEGKSGLHSIETLRTLIDNVHSAPFEAPGKVFLLDDAERMQPAAANALLKTLEEPNPGVTLILVTSSPGEILPTILSRCSRLNFHPLAEPQIAKVLAQRGHPTTFARLAQGSIALALDLATRPALETPLFELLAQRPHYPTLHLALSQLETLIDSEDPIAKQKNVSRIFSSLLMWLRDQEVRKQGGTLFFPDAPHATTPWPPLDAMHKKVSEAMLAFQRNIKFSVCLEQILI